MSASDQAENYDPSTPSGHLIQDIATASPEATVLQLDKYADGKVVRYLISAESKADFDDATEAIRESESVAAVVTSKKVSCIEITVELL